jgi:NADPH:quinone reductase-like Zn-dependent oxidoreductase
MRAVQLTAFGNPVDGLPYVEIPEPDAPGPNQVLIGVQLAAGGGIGDDPR